MGQTISSQQLTSAIDAVQKSISSTLNQVDTNISNIMQVSQNINVTVGPNGKMSCKGGFVIDQEIASNMKVVTDINTEMTTNIKQQLQSEISNSASQLMKVVQGWLAGIGQSVQTNIGMQLMTRLSQIIANQTSQQTMNRINNQVLLVQNQNIVINGVLESDAECKFNQNIFCEMVANAIAKNIVTASVQDSILSSISNQASQTTDITQKGLDDLISALMGPLVIVLIIIIIGVTVLGKEGVKGATNPKFLGLLAAIIVIFMIAAFFFKWWPFPKPAKHWGCEKDSNGNKTGNCVEYSNSSDGPYSDKNTCVNNCLQFWGCEKDSGGAFTGKCVQYDNAKDGPFPNQVTCVQAVADGKACKMVYTCDTDINGFNKGSCSGQNVADIPTGQGSVNRFPSADKCNCPAYFVCSFPSNKTSGKCTQLANPATANESIRPQLYSSDNDCEKACV